ncbi:MAG: hypothetical protein LBV42_01100 [Methanobrevibacter sp.]|jgi:ssDNA-binding Zn-finger/Zn-ribbon topoisomerase 1|nr:hypothetical protein [Methanobrevibacter sp.]
MILILICPKCGGQTAEKQIGLATFLICHDFINCDYYKINKIESIINDPSDDRIEREKQWYEDRFKLFIKREKDKIKAEFIAKEMECLKKEHHDKKIIGKSEEDINDDET